MTDEKMPKPAHLHAIRSENRVINKPRNYAEGPLEGASRQLLAQKEELLLKGDRRLQRLEQVMKAHNYGESALLEVLHGAHDLYGYFDKALLKYIAERLELPPSHVYGVASFYHLFKFVRPGTHVISVCMGTACYIKGAEEIVSAVEKEFNCRRGGSTADGQLSIFITRCMGACAMAPVVVIDNEFIGKATKEIVLEKINKLLEVATSEARRHSENS